MSTPTVSLATILIITKRWRLEKDAMLKRIRDVENQVKNAMSFGSSRDHGTLRGLQDNDHRQYVLAAGYGESSEAIFYYLNEISGVDARTRVGAKIPDDDPDNPGEAMPHLDLVTAPGLGFDEYRVGIDFVDFMFAIRRRVAGEGSWVNILKFDGNSTPISWNVGASFAPTTNNAFDFGLDTYRWRDLFIYRYLNFYGFTTLPTPGTNIANCVTTKRSAVGSYGLEYCKRRYAGDYKWVEVSDMQMTVAVLKDVTGIQITNIGQAAVEILGLAHRVKADLTYMDRCRVVFGGLNSEAATFYCKIQYSTDGSTWYDLTPEGASDGNAAEQFVVSSWGNVPTGALADVYVRAVGRASNDTADPTYKAIELQVR